jgi:hypothetical protein
VIVTKAIVQMSDDDDVGVAGGRTRRSSLVKKGRNRIRTLADSSEDEKELFADSSEEEEPVEVADFSFSPENLKRAMVRIILAVLVQYFYSICYLIFICFGDQMTRETLTFCSDFLYGRVN